MAVNISIVSPTAGQVVPSGPGFVYAVSVQVTAPDTLFDVRGLVRLPPDMPQDLNFIPGNAVFMNPQGPPGQYVSNWMDTPAPIMGQPQQVIFRAWVRAVRVAANGQVTFTLAAAQMGGP